jgi:cyclophilin family peptidyl-prolyl cis-trans isomerase
MRRGRASHRAALMLFVVLAPRPGGQGDASLPSPAARRVAILMAEDRRAPTAGDLATIRAGAHADDATTERIALRALGRLERPELIADIVPGLRHPLPEVRAEAANAIGQAAQGWIHKPPSKAPTRAELDAAAAALAARLSVEADQTVRAAIGESLGRLPYVTADQVEKATRALLGLMARSQSTADRLGVAKGMEAMARLQRLSPLDGDVAGALRTLSTPSSAPGSVEIAARGTLQSPAGGAPDPARGARVRRLAWQALIDAAAADDAVIRGSAADPDAQVRRLVMRAASDPRFRSSDVAADVLRRGLTDASPMVRLEALLALPDHDVEAGLRSGAGPDTCVAAMGATGDPDPQVALAGLDRLAACPSAEAVAMLEHTIDDLSQAGSARGWHRAAHAIVALASSSPERAAATLRQFTDSRNGHLRIYAARAAATLKDRGTLEGLATDDDDNVKEAAIDRLRAIAGHGADGLYLAALATGRYQVLRAAAAALAGTAAPDAVPALGAALHRLVVEGRDNSRDARKAIAETLQGLGVAVDAGPPARAGSLPGFVAADLRRLAAARARVTIRGVGTFELALIASEAPMSVLRFVRLVESGYYNGLTFHRVAPNFVIQGGSPGANEYVGDTTYMRDEVGQWPHVRGAVGISTRGRDTGDAQIFVDLVDNPRLDHEYTVFAQVLNGMEIVDAILEGDVIERIDIVGRS